MNLDFQLPLVAAICSTALAVFGLSRSRDSLPSWALFIGLLTLAAESIFAALTSMDSASRDLQLRWQGQRLVAAAFLPGLWLPFSLGYARGNAEEFLRKWRFVVLGTLALPVAIATFYYRDLIAGVGRGGVSGNWIFQLGWAGLLLHLWLLGGSVLVVMNLERTWRASIGTIRWRIKYMLLGAGLLFVVRGFTATQALLFRVADPTLEELNSGALIVACGLMLRSLRRASRLKTDVYPSKSVIQGSVTVMLAGIYLLVVGAGAGILARMGGGNLFAVEALLILISLALLVVLFQSDRLRLRLGEFVSRNFQRPLYDYRTVWLRFTEGTASQADQTELGRSLVKLVAEVFHCLSVSIWIVDERHERLVLAASTVTSEGLSDVLRHDEVDALLNYFQDKPAPLPFDRASASLTDALGRLHPNKFRRQENRVCLPMIGRGEVIALLVAGDRVGGQIFSTEDLDMLRCVGNHATASLLNMRLADNLGQAKEMQAFQTMAAFFIHDLKNAASTLSIMLQNLPVHFENPAFREDALRGVTKSVAHINHVIGRLGMLRQELKLRASETDLNQVVLETLSGLDAAPAFHVVKDLATLPKMLLDREQIGKVVTNLVINAREAMGESGQVQLSTRAENGWVVLSVGDSGCGMTPEFIERSLFRPFQTTKKRGLGIGMFQSKMIVDIHGGRITVRSEPGSGTTFQVYLPLRPENG